MTKSIRFAVLVAVLLTAAVAQAEEERVTVTPKPRSQILDVRAGAGFMMDPNLFCLTASVEARADRFFSVGPMAQFAFDRDREIVVPTLSARFILPASVMKEKVHGWPDLEFSLHTGFGAMIRSQGSFRFTNFAYQAGLNADYYVIKELTVGLGGLVLVTSSSVETGAAVLYGSVAYHY
jgi:hypothetical protein